MPRPKKIDQERVAAMQDHAERIWEGQSIDLSVTERVRRVVAGLEAQGYGPFIHHLSLPVDGKLSEYL